PPVGRDAFQRAMADRKLQQIRCPANGSLIYFLSSSWTQSPCGDWRAAGRGAPRSRRNKCGWRRPMDRLLRVALQARILVGQVRITTVTGSTFVCGDGTGRPVAIRFTSRAAERGILIDPELRFGEAYMNGGVVVEQGSIADVLAIVASQHGYG